MAIKLKWRRKDIREKHRISQKYTAGQILNEDALIKAMAEADQEVRKKKQLTKQRILSALEDVRNVRFEGAMVIISKGENKRIVKVQWQNGMVEAMFLCWKDDGMWTGKRVGLLEGRIHASAEDSCG